MPLTLTLTVGVLSPGLEKVAFRRLGEAMLRWTGATSSRFLAPNVVGSVHVLEPGQTFAGGEEGPVVFIEWKLPPVAFLDRDVQTGYVAEATQIVHELSGGQHPKERIWVNVLHAVDGSWGIAGHAYTGVELEAAIAQG